MTISADRPIAIKPDEIMTTTELDKGKKVQMEGKSWYVFSLYKEKKLRIGRFVQACYEPPIRKPPVDESSVRIQKTNLDFSINEFEYDVRRIDQEVEKMTQIRMIKKRANHANRDKKPKER